MAHVFIYMSHRKEVNMFLSHYGISQKRKEEKEILIIDYSYKYWCDMLVEECIRMFKWSGLAFPQKEIEIRLM